MSGLFPTMQEKRAALAEKVRALAEPHLPAEGQIDAYRGTAPNLTVETRIREALLQEPDSRDRRRVMGSPICYVRIAYQGGSGGSGLENAGGGEDPEGHAFRVMLWLQYDDTGSHAGSSEALFDDLLEGGEGADGLWSGLRAAGHVQTESGEAADLRFDGEEAPTLVAIKPSASLFAHFAECVVTIT